MYREVDEQVRNAFGVRFGCFDKLVTDAFEDFFLDNIWYIIEIKLVCIWSLYNIKYFSEAIINENFGFVPFNRCQFFDIELWCYTRRRQKTNRKRKSK